MQYEVLQVDDITTKRSTSCLLLKGVLGKGQNKWVERLTFAQRGSPDKLVVAW